MGKYLLGSNINYIQKTRQKVYISCILGKKKFAASVALEKARKPKKKRKLMRNGKWR